MNNSLAPCDSDRLAAAAPDLLRALRMLLERTSGDYYPIEQEMARVAIEKACHD